MIFLGAIALICVSAGIGLVIVSSRNMHVLVREDYYREGLKLDSHRAREAALDSLGFTLTAHTEGRALLVEAAGPGLTDPVSVQRLTGHSLVIQLRRPDDASVDVDQPMTLASVAPPRWVAYLDLRHGHWEARAVFRDSAGPQFEKALTLLHER
jgi:hypothetical protein